VLSTVHLVIILTKSGDGHHLGRGVVSRSEKVHASVQRLDRQALLAFEHPLLIEPLLVRIAGAQKALEDPSVKGSRTRQLADMRSSLTRLGA